MTHPNVDRLNQGYDAFEKGDLDTIRQLFTEDIVFHVPGRSPLAGDYRGQDEVFGFFGKLVELTGGTFKIERHAVLADDAHGAVLTTVTGSRDGKTLSQNAVDIFHFAGDRVKECWALDSDQYAGDEFFS
ncbi:MAG: nuclear transport factor 2 family protein [Actinomycetota bacterium]